MTIIVLLGILGAAGLALALSGGGSSSAAPASGAPVPPELAAQIQRLLTSTQNPEQIEAAAAMLEAQGRPDIATALREHARRLRTVAELARTATGQPQPGAVDPSGIDWGIPGVAPSTSTSPATPPSSSAPLDPSIPAVREGLVHRSRLPLLIETARRVDDALRVRNARRRYNRELVGAFQAMAGLTPDRAYGGMTASALRYFGIVSPVNPFVSPRTATYVPPANLREPSPLGGGATPSRTLDPATWGL